MNIYHIHSQFHGTYIKEEIRADSMRLEDHSITFYKVKETINRRTHVSQTLNTLIAVYPANYTIISKIEYDVEY